MAPPSGLAGASHAVEMIPAKARLEMLLAGSWLKRLSSPVSRQVQYSRLRVVQYDCRGSQIHDAANLLGDHNPAARRHKITRKGYFRQLWEPCRSLRSRGTVLNEYVSPCVSMGTER